MPMPSVGICATGSALPAKKITNYDLEQMIETSSEWIKTRTGIEERRVLEKERVTSDLAAEAARKALADSDIEAKDIELIIVASVTPDKLMPATACYVQEKLGACNAAAFDVVAACSGFIYALTVAKSMIQSGSYNNVLVIGVDVLSRMTDWQDRGTCILFGDGAGAVILKHVEEGYGLLSEYLGSDGSKAEVLMIPGGGTCFPASEETVKARLHYIRMNGSEVFKFAVRVIEEATLEGLRRCEAKPEDLDYLILHQANRRIIDVARKRIGLAYNQVPMHIDRYGNMSAASIPVLLDECVKEKMFKKGDLLAMVAFGAGLTWGSVVMRWC